MSRLFKRQQVQTLAQSRSILPPPPELPVSYSSSAAATATEVEQVGLLLKMAQAEADKILRDARQEAEQLRQTQQQEWDRRMAELEQICQQREEEAAQQGFEQGLSQGREQGIREGMEEGRREWESRLAAIQEALDSANQIREQMVREAEEELIRLCCRITHRVVGQLLQDQEQLLVGMLRRALQENLDEGKVTLLLHPHDLQRIQPYLPELQAVLEDGVALKIQADPGISSPGCIIQSAQVTVDATLDTQMAQIKEQLLSLSHRTRAAQQEGEELVAAHD